MPFQVSGPQKFFSITHGPLLLKINSGSAAKRSSRDADVKYMDNKTFEVKVKFIILSHIRIT